MRSLRNRTRLAAGITGVLTAASLALSTSPASASGTYSGLPYVQGAGPFIDDWGDEGILSTGTHAQSNATCLWQRILWADGFLNSTSDIDGIFGPDTKAATQAWQRYHELDDDGIVGRDTFGSADGGLRDYDSDGSVDTFHGYVRNTPMTRNAQGHYHFYDGDGSGRWAGYNYRTCS